LLTDARDDLASLIDDAIRPPLCSRREGRRPGHTAEADEVRSAISARDARSVLDAASRMDITSCAGASVAAGRGTDYRSD
jgi:hypothetical protein